jgi:hypothetical protein
MKGSKEGEISVSLTLEDYLRGLGFNVGPCGGAEVLSLEPKDRYRLVTAVAAYRLASAGMRGDKLLGALVAGIKTSPISQEDLTKLEEILRENGIIPALEKAGLWG